MGRVKGGGGPSIPRPLFVVLLVCLVAAGCLRAEAPPDAAATGRGLTCSAPCARPLPDGDAQAFEPHVAVHPRDPLHVVVGASEITTEADGPHRWSWSYVSRDGGGTWTRAAIPGGRDAPADHPLAGMDETGDPVVLFLPDGTLLHAGLAFRYDRAPQAQAGVMGGFSVFVARSDDGGLTFPHVSILAEGGGAGLVAPMPFLGGGFGPADSHDKPWLAVGPDGTILATWSNIRFPDPEAQDPFDTLDLLFATSTDGGRTWSEPGVITRDASPHGAFPVMLADGTWVVAFVTFGGDWTLHVARSTDKGASWETEALFATAPVNYPQLARAGDALLLTTAVPQGSKQVPVLMVSRDGGGTWEDPLPLDEAQDEAPSPALAVDGRGAAHVGYYARAGDGLAFRARSFDAGALTPPLDISSAPIAEADPAALGHYFGAAGLPEGAWFVWVEGERPATDLFGASVRAG